MIYRITEKEAFTIIGIGKRFNGETSYVEIPKFWDEYYESDRCKGMNGMFGACVDCDGCNFDYYIADLYLPWQEIPEGYKTITFEKGSWAVVQQGLNTESKYARRYHWLGSEVEKLLNQLKNK